MQAEHTAPSYLGLHYDMPKYGGVPRSQFTDLVNRLAEKQILVSLRDTLKAIVDVMQGIRERPSLKDLSNSQAF